jgi:hypothetical protein
MEISRGQKSGEEVQLILRNAIKRGGREVGKCTPVILSYSDLVFR